MTAKEALQQAKEIIIAMKMGVIAYDDAKAKCQPLLDIANIKSQEIAKKHGIKYRPIIFAGFAR